MLREGRAVLPRKLIALKIKDAFVISGKEQREIIIFS